MPAYGYEFYLLVVNSISHEWAQRTSEISSWPLKDKIHIHARACNILYMHNLFAVFNDGEVLRDAQFNFFSINARLPQIHKLNKSRLQNNVAKKFKMVRLVIFN